MGVQQYANLALDAAGNVLGSSAVSPAGGYTSSINATLVFKLSLFSQRPIRMTLSQPTAPLGVPVTLNWTVSNASSLSAQQCSAHGATGTAGGAWTGKQAGVADSSGYYGSTVLTPTAAGTYSYELTCGGTQSSVVSLVVQ